MRSTGANGWTHTTLGTIRCDATRSIDPRKSPSEVFDLYSVPAHASGGPEDVRGSEVGSSKRLVEPGTVLVCKINPRINRTWVVDGGSGRRQIASTEWIPFSPTPDVVPNFLAYFMQQEVFRQHLATNVSGVGGSLMRVRPRVAEEFPFAYPDIESQEQLVAKLDELFSDLDAGVTALERAKANLARYRAAVLKAAVEGKLTKEWRRENPDVEPASELLKRVLRERRTVWEGEQLAKYAAKGKRPPSGWREKYKEPTPALAADTAPARSWVSVSLGQVALFQNGRAFPSKEYSNVGTKLLRPGNLYADGSVRWITKNTRRMPPEWEQRHPDYVVGGGELVMNLTAQSLADEFLGRVCLTDDGEHCLLNQRLARITPIDGASCKYLLYVLKSERFRRFVNGLNTGSLIQHMFTSDLADFTFPLPPKDEQCKIVAATERHLEVIERVGLQIGTQQQRVAVLHQSVLASAFAGRLAGIEGASG